MKPVAARAVSEMNAQSLAVNGSRRDTEQLTQVLRRAQFVRWSAQVLHSGDDETPLHHWGPEKDSFWTCFMHTRWPVQLRLSAKDRARADQQGGS